MILNSLTIVLQLVILWLVHSVKGTTAQVHHWSHVIDVLAGMWLLSTLAGFWLSDWLSLRIIDVVLSLLMVGAISVRLWVLRRG
jgi:hypothetical protein